MSHIKYLSMLALTVTVFANASWAYTYKFVRFPDFDAFFDARLLSGLCKDRTFMVRAKSDSMHEFDSNCWMNSVRVRVYDPACSEHEVLTGEAKADADRDYEIAMAVYKAQIEMRAQQGIPISGGSQPVTTQPTTMPPGQSTEWQLVQHPQTKEWMRIRPYQQGTGTPGMPSGPMYPPLVEPSKPGVTRNYCQAEGSHETAVPGSYTYTVVKTSASTEKPKYKVIKS